MSEQVVRNRFGLDLRQLQSDCLRGSGRPKQVLVVRVRFLFDILFFLPLSLKLLQKLGLLPEFYLLKLQDMLLLMFDGALLVHLVGAPV